MPNLSCTLHVLSLSAFQDTAKVLKNKSDVDLVGRDGEEGWQCRGGCQLTQVQIMHCSHCSHCTCSHSGSNSP